jgi:hypothetical protein
MLEHQKTVLQAVAGNEQLFRKELQKSLTWLNNEEITLLKKWVNENFQNEHSKTISQVFSSKRAYA